MKSLVSPTNPRSSIEGGAPMKATSISTKVRVALATVVLVGCAAVAFPTHADAGVNWTDGAYSQFDARCKSGVQNIELAFSSSGSGRSHYQYWVRDVYTGQWAGPSGLESPGYFFIRMPLGTRLQFYIRHWHQFSNGQWASSDEWGYVTQDYARRGFGGVCQV